MTIPSHGDVAPGGGHTSVGRCFEAAAAAHPDAVALVSPTARLTYAELNARANALARRLRRSGAAAGARVALCLEHDVDTPVAMLGVLKAGGAYVPLDLNFPDNRLRTMLEDSGATLLVGSAATLRRARDLAGGGCAVVDIAAIATEAGAGNPPDAPPADALAYVLYTSGSTGRPKGVLQTHGNLLHHARVWTRALGIAPGDRMSLVSSFGWDSAIQDMYGALLNGASAYVFDVRAEGFAALAGFVMEHDLGICHFTVPLARQVARTWLDAGRRPNLRVLALGADMINRSDVELFASVLPPDCLFVNAYGATESTTAAIYTFTAATPVPCYPVPIGHPVAATDILLVDDARRPVADGEVGEIVIRSPHVAVGYLNQPQLTAERFTTEADDPRVRSYFTGDLGLRLAGGACVLRGRRDDVVKVRGFRVALGEVEATLAAHPDVQAAVVLAFARPSGHRKLAAYLVPRPGRVLDAIEVRGFVAARLPDFMIPSAFTLLADLPLTPNRKIDRAALPEPEWRRRALSRPYVAPRTPRERVLAELVAEIVEQDRVGVHDDFFELGGDSLDAMTLAVRAGTAGLALHVSQVFRHPTVAELAELAAAAPAAADHPARGRGDIAGTGPASAVRETVQRLVGPRYRCEDAYPLTPTQQGVYLGALLAGRRSEAYIEQLVVRIQGALDADVLEGAWRHVVDRHTILRTGFARRGLPEVHQFVCAGLPVGIERLDWREPAPAATEERLAAYRRAQIAAGFNVAEPPLVRLALVRVGDDSYRLVWTYHHLLLDGWSESVVLEELLACYAALVRGTAPALPPVRPFRDFVDWLAGCDTAAAEAFWKRTLDGIPMPTPLGLGDRHDRSARPARGYDVLEVRRAPHDLAAACRRSGLTLNTVLEGAWALVLFAESGAREVVFGSAASGRGGDLAGLDGMVGLFVSVLPVPVRCERRAPVLEWLSDLQEDLAEIRRFEHTPPDVIRRSAGHPDRRADLFESVIINVAFQHLSNVEKTVAGLRVEASDFTSVPHYPLTLFTVLNADLMLRFVFARAAFSDTAVHRLAMRYCRILDALDLEAAVTIDEVLRMTGP